MIRSYEFSSPTVLSIYYFSGITEHEGLIRSGNECTPFVHSDTKYFWEVMPVYFISVNVPTQLALLVTSGNEDLLVTEGPYLVESWPNCGFIDKLYFQRDTTRRDLVYVTFIGTSVQ